MFKHRKKVLFAVLLFIVIYILGPAPAPPTIDMNMPIVPQDSQRLEAYIKRQEQNHTLKPDNEAQIVWFDGKKQRTPYSVVYLHGFSASHKEGDPVHTEFAKKFGCNLYLARLADHGIDSTDQMIHFTVNRLWNSAKQALAIGKAIGEKVIIMSTSTGGSIALMLAANYPKDVYALINMSPNVAINDPFAFLLNNHWGLQVARLVVGGKFITNQQPKPEYKKYWYDEYRVEALTQLQELIEREMNENTFKKVKQPSLTLYYYKDQEHQDPVVKVSAILNMHQALGTDNALKVALPIPNAGTHVLGSSLKSKDIPSVNAAIAQFAQEKLGMTPVD